MDHIEQRLLGREIELAKGSLASTQQALDTMERRGEPHWLRAMVKRSVDRLRGEVFALRCRLAGLPELPTQRHEHATVRERATRDRG